MLPRDWPTELILARCDEDERVLKTIYECKGWGMTALDDGLGHDEGKSDQCGCGEEEMVPRSMVTEVEARMKEREGLFDQERGEYEIDDGNDGGGRMGAGGGEGGAHDVGKIEK